MPDIDIGELSEAINDKMDRDLNNRTDGSGLRKLVESYTNGSSWYKVFDEIQANGTIKKWCEQGGLHTTGTADAPETINLLKQYADTNYKVYKTMGCGDQSTYNNNTFGIAVFMAWGLTTSSFITWGPVNGAVYQYIWKTEGYIS